MADIHWLLERIAPEPNLEMPVDGDPEPLQHIDVETRYAALDPADALPIDSRKVGEVLLRPVPAQPRGADLAAELGTLLSRPSISLGDKARAPPAAQGAFASCMVAE